MTMPGQAFARCIIGAGNLLEPNAVGCIACTSKNRQNFLCDKRSKAWELTKCDTGTNGCPYRIGTICKIYASKPQFMYNGDIACIDLGFYPTVSLGRCEYSYGNPFIVEIDANLQASDPRCKRVLRFNDDLPYPRSLQLDSNFR